MSLSRHSRWIALVSLLCTLFAVACNSGNGTTTAPAQPPFMSVVAQTPPTIPPEYEAPPPEKTGGFDGKRAFEQVVKQVSFGPRSPGTPAIAKLQEYLESELKSYGCAVETDSFSADTPVGRVPMKNILVKIPGEKPGIIMLGTHYDTKRMDNFVGADDAGSSTGVTLELARLLCKRPGKYAVWIAFFDAEEAFNPTWVDPDHTYGSRQMTAKLAASEDLPKIRAFILTDLVGGKNPHFLRDGESTKWLRDMVWNVAARLGYAEIFPPALTNFGGDDHYSFTARKVPSVDVMDLDTSHDVPYWHTPEDTIDKISPKTLAIVGHVVLESVNELQKK
jgi:glutaminyl-peptide cyclotransferase